MQAAHVLIRITYTCKSKKCISLGVYNKINHNYNKILESDWFLARPIFYQIGARAAKVSNNKVSNNKVSNNKVSNNKVRVVRMRALFIWFLVVSFKNGFFAFISDDKSLVGFALSNFFLEFCYSYD